MTRTGPEGFDEPRGPEIEAARLLANDHRERLEAEGLTAEQIRRLADDYVASTQGTPEGFPAWALRRAERDDAG